jgi:hypothetical protein
MGYCRKGYFQKRIIPMSRRLPGLLVLMFLLIGFFYARSAWAESDGVHSANVLVRVSPLTLLTTNAVTIKVGEFSCQLVFSGELSSLCADLPPGDYKVSAYSEGYIVLPLSYTVNIPGDPEDSEDSVDAVGQETEFYFKFYKNNHQIYMPNLLLAK